MKEVEYTAEEAAAIEKRVTLKSQAVKLMSMKELWSELGDAMATADSKADNSLGEQHQRDVGAKIALKEFMGRVEHLAKYQAPERKKGGNSYA